VISPTRLLSFGLILCAATPAALADTISPGSSFTLSGNDTYTSSTITFGTAQLGAATDTGTTQITGTFASYLTDGTSAMGGSSVTFVPSLNYSQGQHTLGSAVPVFSITGDGETFVFSLQSYNADYTVAANNAANNTLLVFATGYFTGSGPVTYTSTPGIILISSQVEDGHSTTTFSGSAAALAAAPEPASFALLGTGLAGAAALMQRRRRQLA
jgi:hypothetical protein